MGQGHWLYLTEGTGKPRSGFVGWQVLLRKGFLPEAAVAGPNPAPSFLSHPSKYVLSGNLLPSSSPTSTPALFCALSVNGAAQFWPPSAGLQSPVLLTGSQKLE